MTVERLQSSEHEVNNPLTERETEILRLAARGLTNTKIAPLLKIQPSTVKTHMEKTLKWLEAESRKQAVLKGVELGIVSLEEATAGLNVETLSTLTDKEERVSTLSPAVASSRETIPNSTPLSTACLRLSASSHFKVFSMCVFTVEG